jgi:hypothetical protein
MARGERYLKVAYDAKRRAKVRELRRWHPCRNIGDLPEAAWFLKYQTYVDDAVAGANSLDRLKELLAELEMVAAHGGFQFIETLMSGDAAADPFEPRKVLGLVWETREDKLQVDVKLNTGGKVGRPRIQEDINLKGI